jgi:hypothetical protein
MLNPRFNNSHSDDHSCDSLESLIRAAGDYIHPSSDLRPRTLETAQLRFRQQRRFSGVAIAALILAVLLPSGSGQQDPLHLFSHLSIPAISQSLQDPNSSDRPLSHAAGSNTLRAGLDANWMLVDIFTQLRRQQAALLHGARSTK